MQQYALGIIEDMDEIRNSLVTYFSQQPEISSVVAAGSVEAFLDLPCTSFVPEIIISDIGLPGMDGIEGISKIRELYPDADIIMLTVFNNSERIFKSICAGATGYALKDTPLPELKKGILDVKNGGSFMNPSIARKVLGYFAPKKSQESRLNDREHQIVVALTEGLSYKLVADRLSMSLDNVRYHIKAVYRKLQVNSKSEVMGKFHRGEL